MNRSTELALVFPNQLFDEHPALRSSESAVGLIEDSLYFGDWFYSLSFHKQKLWLHRASMRRYAARLESKGFNCHYCEYSQNKNSLLHHLRDLQKSLDFKTLVTVEPVDFILEKRLTQAAQKLDVELDFVDNPLFLNTQLENTEYHREKNRWLMTDFYKWQRQRFDILIEEGEPVGGKWSFDQDNRKKVPKKMLNSIPSRLELDRDELDQEARDYVEQQFPDHPGSLETLYYPTSSKDARTWLSNFLDKRLENFGAFEDAIEEGESWLWHSVLTPALNIGLLTPREIVDATLKHAEQNEIPLNSLEGFLRQVIGWREFMRSAYQELGVKMRTSNHWDHQRPLADSFYTGTTGIAPIDDTIHRILDTGYCHHIERLMVLGGFMFLCEFQPEDIYNWFMEMFVDSYDWVMVPNVFAMSQHADGGLITTKPYFSGSSYVRKMSHYDKGDWCDVWDGLYWRWILDHQDALSQNPRWSMMCSMAKKMDSDKKKKHRQNAETFLASL